MIMENEEKQSVTQSSPTEMHAWGQMLANGLWVVTLLMVLAFFWQSFGEMLVK
jgi:hypothetical protein